MNLTIAASRLTATIPPELGRDIRELDDLIAITKMHREFVLARTEGERMWRKVYPGWRYAEQLLDWLLWLKSVPLDEDDEEVATLVTLKIQAIQRLTNRRGGTG